MGLPGPLHIGSSTLCSSHSPTELFPFDHQGKGSPGEVGGVDRQRGCRAHPFISRLLQSPVCGPEGFGLWRPVIDLSSLNGFVQLTPFRMESNQSVLQSIRSFDWMISIDLKDAYLQVPIHPNSRKFLRFVANDRVYQFKALCFGLSTAPQVFTRVMAPVSSFLHSQGTWMLQYLDDWLILASSHLEARDKVKRMCSLLGIVVNLEKSSLVPSQTAAYLGMVLVSPSLRAFPTPKQVENVREQITRFLSYRRQRVVSWRTLLGCLTSLYHLIPGGRLRLRSLQLCLRESWDFVNELVSVEWTDMISSDLQWWSDDRNILARVSLATPHTDHHFWSDASDQGWGAHVGDQFVSGRWSQEEIEMAINLRELRAICLALQHFQCQLAVLSVGVFADNTTVLAYVQKQGGTHSRLLNEEARLLLRWAEKQQILLLSQFVIGIHSVVADTLSQPNEVIVSEWILAQEVVHHLFRRWPPNIDLSETALNHRLPVYFAPMADPALMGTDALLQCWDHLQAYAFPPFRLVRHVLNKFLESANCELTLVAPWWPQQEWFPDLHRQFVGTSFNNLISIITISIRGCWVFTR